MTDDDGYEAQERERAARLGVSVETLIEADREAHALNPPMEARDLTAEQAAEDVEHLNWCRAEDEYRERAHWRRTGT